MPNAIHNNRALVIGVGADLPNTVADATGLAQVLADPARCNFAPANVTALAGEQATRAGILAALDDLAQRAEPESTALVFFSGHGYQVESPTGQVYYLMPYGYDLNKLYKTCVSGQEFADKLAAIPSQRLLLLLDACHAEGIGESKAPGLTFTKSPLPPEAQALFAQGSGRIVVTSCKADELSFTGTPFSLFTRAVVECLCGAEIKEGDGTVRALDLAMYASRKVAKWSRDRQHPTADTQKADNFVVAYYAAGAKAPLPIDLPPVEEDKVEADNAQAIRMLQQTINQSGGVNFGQGNTVSITGDVVGGDKVMGDQVTGNQLKARDLEGENIVVGKQEIHYHYGDAGAPGGGVPIPQPAVLPMARQLVELLVGYFTLSDMEGLEFELGLMDGTIAGDTLGEHARALASYCQQHGALEDLRRLMAAARPNLKDRLARLESGVATEKRDTGEQEGKLMNDETKLPANLRAASTPATSRPSA